MIKEIKTLVTYIKYPTTYRARVFQHGNKVYIEQASGNPIERVSEDFETFEEAKAFVRGLQYLVTVSGGSIGYYMEQKNVEVAE